MGGRPGRNVLGGTFGSRFVGFIGIAFLFFFACAWRAVVVADCVAVAAASVVRPEVVGRRPLDGGREGPLTRPLLPRRLVYDSSAGWGRVKRGNQRALHQCQNAKNIFRDYAFQRCFAMSETLYLAIAFQLSNVLFFLGFCEGMKLLRSPPAASAKE